MSEVISLRLNRENPREAKPLKILKARQVEGYSVRQVVTEGLLNLVSAGPSPAVIITTGELIELMGRVTNLLEQIELTDKLSNAFNGSFPSLELKQAFIRSVRQNIKLGIKME
jgi:hypothetical protein